MSKGSVFASLLFLLSIVAVNGDLPTKFFDVRNYGAVSSDVIDNTQAFLKTWKDACAYPGRSRMWIPYGTFYVGSVTFLGSCNGSIDFVIKGTLKAPLSNFFGSTWIVFRYVNHLTVRGGGSLDGQGAFAWSYNDCQKNQNCKSLPATMTFDFVTNSSIHNIHSINSKNSHFNIFASNNLNISYINISAPGDSPNTDGIRIGYSKNIQISHSTIGTGDDCVAMIAGSQNITISDVACGPGHGISIGSLAGGHPNDYVSGIKVSNCTLTDTQNGLRIKTWAPSSYNRISDVSFEDIQMQRVRNPIVIDQNYCPSGCGHHSNSGVEIRDVTYKNIYGISASEVALDLKCSGSEPCKNVKLIDINLTYNGKGKAKSQCSNVIGSSYGKQNPGKCT